jgi:PAS domain S-box-containing protein
VIRIRYRLNGDVKLTESTEKAIQLLYKVIIAALVLCFLATGLTFYQFGLALSSLLLVVLDILLVFALQAVRTSLEELALLKTEVADSFKMMDKIASQELSSDRASSQWLTDSSSSSSIVQRLGSLAGTIRELRKRERSIIDNAVDVICVLDVHGNFLSVSPSAQRVWGYGPDKLLGKNIKDFLVSEDADQTLATVLGAQQSIGQLNFENKFQHRKGQMVELEWSAHWSATDNGLFCIAHDITERKLAESRLMESEARLRTILEAMPVGVVTCSQGAIVEFANLSMQEFAGIDDKLLLATSALDLVIPKDKETFRQYLLGSKSNAAQKPMESKIERTDGKQLAIEIFVVRFVVQSVNKLLIIFADVTQRKEVERLRNEFVSMVNHDLRAPLTSFSGLFTRVESGAYGELSREGKDVFHLARLELDRLMRLVGDLLDLDKLDSGKLVLEPDTVAVLDIIEASVSSVKAYADVRNISISYEEVETACYADRRRIIQVMVNLLSNAIKFSPDNSDIEIQVEELADSSATYEEAASPVKISISDQGRGIPPEKLGLLFERFQQVKPEDALERAGSGLGLSICKAIIEAHNGTITCNNKPSGNGSTFSFTLPAKD